MRAVGPSANPVSLAPLWGARAAMQRSDERLATGLRLNRGADDPAGLIASERLGTRQAELSGRMAAMEREGLTLRATDGALAALGRMGTDLAGLVVQSANAGAMGPGEADGVRSQIGAIARAIDGAAGAARFNGSRILDGFDTGALGRTQISTDPDSGEPVYASVRNLERLAAENPEAAQVVVRAANEQIAVARAEAGARERGLEAERRAAEIEFINTARARSSIRDTDYARETGERVRAGLLEAVSIRTILIDRQARAQTIGLLLGTRIDTTA
jgi:flagellin-like hook-associated protein FlgL